jgi:mono/diheme cytochrome c family protein
MVRAVVALACVLLASSALGKEWPGKIPPRAERGQAFYATYCVSCHGPEAKGDGPASAALVAPVPDFSEGFGDRKTEVLLRSVTQGKGLMPGFELSLSRPEAEIVLEYMGTVGREGPAPEDDDEADGDEDEGEGEAQPGE